MAAKLHHLSNGTPVVIDEVPHVKSATVGFYFQVGARFEDKKTNGIAHFLEHMAFKGTKTRNARQLITEMENLGASPNAFTSKDATCYFIKGLAEDTPKFIEILNDIVQNSVLPPDEIERERGAIIEEIGGYKDSPDSVLREMSEAASYPAQPLGRTILGPVENIRNMTRGQLQNFMKKHYHAGNLIVSVAGNVKPQEVLAELEKTVGTMPVRPKSAFYRASHGGGTAAHQEKALEQLRVMFSFKAYKLSDPKFWSADLLSDILGGGMSSRLFHEIREKRGLVYTVAAYTDATRDVGTLDIYAATGPDKIETLVPVLCDELNKIRRDGVSDEELARVKKQLLTRLAMQDESMMNRMIGPARSLQLHGKLRDADAVTAAIKNVTTESIKDVANEIFAGKPVIASIGPGGKMEPYKKTVKRLEP